MTKRNVKLCNWQNSPRDIFTENESELSINLDKNTTIALVGHFDFRVSRGAININGANIGAVTRDGQKAKTYRAYVPATQPIFKIRGLDGKNHVQFTSCKEPTPFAKLNPLWEDIWNSGSRGERRRTFGIVSGSFFGKYLQDVKQSTDIEYRLPTLKRTLLSGPCSRIRVQKIGFVQSKTARASLLSHL